MFITPIHYIYQPLSISNLSKGKFLYRLCQELLSQLLYRLLYLPFLLFLLLLPLILSLYLFPQLTFLILIPFLLILLLPTSLLLLLLLNLHFPLFDLFFAQKIFSCLHLNVFLSGNGLRREGRILFLFANPLAFFFIHFHLLKFG